ncbi:MAG: hypothetical protein Q4C86_09800 [bacterium]|nr:hypothetical protein [bacterium]
MKNTVRGCGSLSIIKAWICLLAVVTLCLVSSVSYAGIINSNGTGKYVINGDHTWGLNTQNETISSLIVNNGSSLRLLWGEAEPGKYCIGNIFGDGNLEISGGGQLFGDWGIVGQEGNLAAGYQVYGLKNIKNITLMASDNLPGFFNFSAFPYETDYWGYKSVSLNRQTLVAENVKQSSLSDMQPLFEIGQFANKDISINGGVSVSLNSSDFASASLAGFINGSLNIVGDSEISVVGSTAVASDSLSKKVTGVGGTIIGGANVDMNDAVAASTKTEIISDSKFALKGQCRIMAKDVTVASEGALDGFLNVIAAGQTTGTSGQWKAMSEVDSSYIEISGITFAGTGKHSLHVHGAGSAMTYSGDGTNLSQSPGSAESKIWESSEIVIIGTGAFSGLRHGDVYCGGTVLGKRALSTVGSALLTFKDIDARNAQGSFSGVISGQGLRTEYPTGDPTAPVTTDYTDSVLGDSVLILDNVKADISSSDVNVKYFDEVILKNNTSVKMTAFDSDLKKVTVSGNWSSASGAADALTFKEEVKNRDMIAVAVEADAVASGVTKAAWSDDGTRLIVYTAGAPQPPAPSDSGSSGGCRTGCGTLAVFALMAIPSLITTVKKLKRSA